MKNFDVEIFVIADFEQFRPKIAYICKNAKAKGESQKYEYLTLFEKLPLIIPLYGYL